MDPYGLPVSRRARLAGLLPALLVCACLSSARAERLSELPPGALVATPQALGEANGEARDLARRWTGLADAQAWDALGAELPAESGAGVRLAAELAAARLVRHLQDRPAGRTPQAAALLRSLAGRPPRVWSRHEETRGDWFVPLVDVGGDAQAALALLAAERRRDEWVAKLEGDAGAAFGQGFDRPGDVLRAAEAVALVDQQAFSEALAYHAGGKHSLPAPVLQALAVRSGDPALHAAAIAATPAGGQAALVGALPRHLPDGQAVALLLNLSTRTDTGPAALLALGGFAGDPAVLAHLLDQLGRPRLGPSAAAALARSGAAVTAALGDHAAKDGRADVLRDVALALRLQGTPAALHALDALARDPRLPATARAELQP